MKKIYIVLSSGSGLSKRTYRTLTDFDYDHVSVSFEKDLSVMYSFAKLYLYVPLVGGFVTEHPSRYMAKGGDVKIKIFAYEVSEEEYARVNEVIRRMTTHPQIYSFNIYDKAASVVGGSFSLRRSYTDLSFVCRLLRFGNVKTIKELDFILQPCLTYEGTMNEITEGVDEFEGAEYFRRIPKAKALPRSAAYSLKLLLRKAYEMV